MITDVTVPARLCKCEATLKNGQPCLYEWVSIAVLIPSHCQNRECRSREWNGRKEKKIPTPKPVLVLPKAIRVRGGNEDDGF